MTISCKEFTCSCSTSVVSMVATDSVVLSVVVEEAKTPLLRLAFCSALLDLDFRLGIATDDNGV